MVDKVRDRTARQLCEHMLDWGFGVGELAYSILHTLDRLDNIDKFIHDNLMSTEFKIKENPQAVKPTGLVKCTRCFPGRPGLELIDCDGSAGFRVCPDCDGYNTVKVSTPEPSRP